MTPKSIVVKIQELLSSSGSDGLLFKRVVALAYCRQCSLVNALLEHCASMIKTGREYHAIIFAEANALLENVREFSFEEIKIWENYCRDNNLPFPLPFDGELVELVSSLYQKRVVQSHPIYRDYRRAMRLREFEKALCSITTIAKINTADSSAKMERERLRKNVIERKLKRLGELLASADVVQNAEFKDTCAFLEANGDYSRGRQEFENALKLISADNEKNFAGRADEILHQLQALSVDTDFGEIIALLFELFSTSLHTEISPEKLADVESIVSSVSAKINDEIEIEKSRRATALIARELENPTSKKLSEKLSKLKSLRREAGAYLGAEATKILNRKIMKMRLALFVRNTARLATSVAILAALGYLGYVSSIKFHEKNEIANFERALNRIALLENPVRALDAVKELENKYARYLQDTALKAKIEQIKAQASASSDTIYRIEKLLNFVENIDASKATTNDYAEASSAIEKVSNDVYMLPLSVQASIKSRIDKVQSRLSDEIEALKLGRDADIRKFLAQYEELLREYESFSKDRVELDKKFEAISPKLRALMEDTTAMFRPHQIDVDKYNDISGRIMEAKSRYADFDDGKKTLLSSKSFNEYIAVAKLLKENPFTPATFYKNLTKIVDQTNRIKFGQLADFAVVEATDCAERIGEFARLSDELPPILGDVYFYNRANGNKIFTLGKAVERKNIWIGGKESMQRVTEILENGNTNQVLFRQHQLDGEPATGENLSDETLTPEAQFAREIANIAVSDSLLYALECVGKGKVSPVFKMMLEEYLFVQMRKNPIFSGLLFSKVALAREKLVRKYSRDLGFHSWIFEPETRNTLIEKELYSTSLPDLKRDAKICIAAIIQAKKIPLKMVGIMGEQGRPIIFGEVSGVIWAVENSSGEFKKVSNNLDDVSKIAELSPIFTEIKSSESILADVAKDVK